MYEGCAPTPTALRRRPREIANEDELEFANGSLRFVPRPSTRPLVLLLRDADRTIIAALRPQPSRDRCVPHPQTFAPLPSLAEYLVTSRACAFAPTLVHGGHGEPVHDYEELFNRYLRAIRERQSAVIQLVPKTGATAWDVSREMFPDSTDVHRFLAVSESAAHLDLAHSEGKLAAEIDAEGREVYRRRVAADFGSRS